MELLKAFVSACQNIKFSSVCIILLGLILFYSVKQRIVQSNMSEQEKKVQLQGNWKRQQRIMIKKSNEGGVMINGYKCRRTDSKEQLRR